MDHDYRSAPTLPSPEKPEDWPPGSSLAMIAACFRHQHPEAEGREAIAQVDLPEELRTRREEMRPSTLNTALPEERFAYPGAMPLDQEPFVGRDI